MVEILIYAAAAYTASLVSWLVSFGVPDEREDVNIVGIFLKANEGARFGGYVVAVTTMATLYVLARRRRRPAAD